MAQPLEERSLEWVSRRDPARFASGGVALVWVPHGEAGPGTLSNPGGGGSVLATVNWDAASFVWDSRLFWDTKTPVPQ